MKTLIQFSCASLVLLASTAHANQVKTLSPEVFVDGQIRSWEVVVQCAGAAGNKIISKPVAGGDWCLSNDGSVCHNEKETLALQLCGGDLSASSSAPEAQVTEEPSAPAVAAEAAEKPVGLPANVSDPALLSMSRNELLEEKMRIEEVRIQIQQRHVELRKREIELQKRRLGTS